MKSFSKPRTAGIGFATGLYAGIVLIFFAVTLEGQRAALINRFSNVYFLLALAGAIFGFLRLRNYGGGLFDKYRVMITLWSVGLLSWFIGDAIWFYYVFALQIDEPYPGPSDIFYVLGYLLFTVAIIGIYKIVKINPLNSLGPLITLLVAGWGAIFGMMLWIRDGIVPLPQDDMLSFVKFALDVFYPAIGVLEAALAITLVLTIIDDGQGFMGAALVLTFATITNFVGDIIFNFTTTVDVSDPLHYYNGNAADMFYATALYWFCLFMLVLPVPDASDQKTAIPREVVEASQADG